MFLYLFNTYDHKYTLFIFSYPYFPGANFYFFFFLHLYPHPQHTNSNIYNVFVKSTKESRNIKTKPAGY